MGQGQIDKKVSVVQGRIDQLSGKLSVIDTRVGELHDKLQPVLSQSVPPTAQTAAEKPPESPLANQLESLLEATVRIESGLASLMERIQC